VYDIPEASFIASQTIALVRQSVEFFDNSTNAPTEWLWDFGDGAVSSVKNPTHIYTQSGQFDVSLTVSNPAGQQAETKVKYIQVYHLPVVGFDAMPRISVVGKEVQFVDESLNDVNSWTWNFGDGQLSAEQNPSHIYTQIGTFSISLSVKNPAASDTLTRSGFIKVVNAGADTNCDGHVDLKDAIVSLQVLVGMAPGLACELNIPDVNGDNRVGLPEAIYVLQLIAK
jgi:PKD repeat protein